MKKIKLDQKLSFSKKTVTRLNDTQMSQVVGGGFLSLWGSTCNGALTCAGQFTCNNTDAGATCVSCPPMNTCAATCEACTF